MKCPTEGEPCVVVQVTGVSVTQGTDQLIAVHLSGGNDLVLCLQSANNNEERVGELVGVIASNMQKSVDLSLLDYVRAERLGLFLPHLERFLCFLPHLERFTAFFPI